jgi:hypothetical protein
MERAAKEGLGTHTLVRPDATIVVSGEPVEPEPDPEPEPEPEPEPSPEPEPEPEPEPQPTGKPQDITRAINQSARINFDYWNGGSRYQRFQNLIVWDGDTATVGFKRQDGGGGLHPLDHVEYTLTANGRPLATATIQPGDSSGEFAVDVTQCAEGWNVLDIPTSGAETTVPFPVFVLRGELPVQEWVPSFTGSYDTKDLFHLKWVPARMAPTLPPLERRAYPHFDTTDGPFYLENITGTLSAQVRRLYKSKDGVLTTTGRQWYTWGDAVSAKPRLPLLDGTRGVGNIGYPTHISIGTGQQDDELGSPGMDNLYVTDPWRLCRVGPSGSVTTLVGYRHGAMADYWDDPQHLELVGDWSAIPVERRGFHELWGMCWYPESLKVDNSADRIPEEGNRRPHITAPVAFLADSQNNRVCRVEFDARAHGVPPKVTEFVLAPDCWDCVEWRDEIIVSVRGEHRISAYDKKTGALKRHIVQGEPLATVDRNRFVIRTGTIDAIRAQDVVQPEGLYVVGDWLYFGSAAMAQVKRVHLIDGRIETLYSPSVSGAKGSNYYKISVSDGTAGPEGQIFISNWTVTDYGAPKSIGPDGNQWRVMRYNSAGVARGVAGGYSSTGYSAAVAAKNGRIVWGGSNEGLRSMSLALPSDERVDLGRFRASREAWEAKGYHISHGDNAENFFGLPLPADADGEYFLKVSGY